jgi:hypothetical protein
MTTPPPATITLESTGVEYKNLQSAILDADPFYDIITITAGSVPIDPTVQITIAGKNNLFILGNNTGINPITSTRNNESVIDFRCVGTTCPNTNASCSSNGINIDSINIIIDGFTIQGNQCGYGVTTTSNSGGIRIRNNIIQNNANGIFFNSRSNSKNTIFQNSIVNNNNANGGVGFIGNGIFSNQLDSATIDSNFFTGHISRSIFLNVDSSFEFNITNVSIENNNSTNDAGFQFIRTGSSLEISGNIINSSIFEGILFSGGCSGVVIANNCILSSTYEGISIIDSVSNINSDITISPGNSIVCNGSSGIVEDPHIAILVTSDGYNCLAGGLDATGNYLGPNLGQSPDNIIVDQSGCVDSSGTLVTPARECPGTPCDPVAPCVITCSPSFVVTVPRGSTGSTVTFDPPSFTGNCGQVTCNPPSGSFFPLGVNNVTCLSSTFPIQGCPFTITVKVATPIHFDSKFILCEEVCHQKKVEETKCEKKKEEKNKGKKVFYPSSIIVSAIGLGLSCSTLTFNPPSGSFFPLGLTLVVATDANENTFSFFVSVRGAAPPFKTPRVLPFKTPRETAPPCKIVVDDCCEKKHHRKEEEKVEKKNHKEKVEKKNCEKPKFKKSS